MWQSRSDQNYGAAIKVNAGVMVVEALVQGVWRRSRAEQLPDVLRRYFALSGAILTGFAVCLINLVGYSAGVGGASSVVASWASEPRVIGAIVVVFVAVGNIQFELEDRGIQL